MLDPGKEVRRLAGSSTGAPGRTGRSARRYHLDARRATHEQQQVVARGAKSAGGFDRLCRLLSGLDGLAKTELRFYR